MAKRHVKDVFLTVDENSDGTVQHQLIIEFDEESVLAAAPQAEGPAKSYTPEELYDVACNTRIPVNFQKKQALFNLIRALEQPDEQPTENAAAEQIGRSSESTPDVTDPQSTLQACGKSALSAVPLLTREEIEARRRRLCANIQFPQSITGQTHCEVIDEVCDQALLALDLARDKELLDWLDAHPQVILRSGKQHIRPLIYSAIAAEKEEKDHG